MTESFKIEFDDGIVTREILDDEGLKAFFELKDSMGIKSVFNESGEDIFLGARHVINCSICGKQIFIKHGRQKYCPNCMQERIKVQKKKHIGENITLIIKKNSMKDM